MKSACAIAAAILIAVQASGQSAGYADLVSLFADWRAFQKPKVVDGVPDYTAAAMAAQQRDLPAYQRRLAAIKDKHQAEKNPFPGRGFKPGR